MNPGRASWVMALKVAPPQPRWGQALREQNQDNLVRCTVCDRAALLTPRTRSSAHRQGWPALRCVFAADCPGWIVPEYLN